jgi:hypothetical protein
MIIVETLPSELLDVLKSPEFDDEAGILIESVQYSDDDLCLTFTIRFYDNVSQQQLWQVKVEDVKDEKIVRNWTQSIELYKTHPILLEYTDVHTELYFKGLTRQSHELFIDIFESVIQLSSNIEDVLQYIFTPNRVNELSQQGYGLFASGPKTVLKIYEQCLIKYNIHAYFVSEYEQSKENQKLKYFKLGNSYVIGKTFLFKRLS